MHRGLSYSKVPDENTEKTFSEPREEKFKRSYKTYDFFPISLLRKRVAGCWHSEQKSTSHFTRCHNLTVKLFERSQTFALAVTFFNLYPIQ